MWCSVPFVFLRLFSTTTLSFEFLILFLSEGKDCFFFLVIGRRKVYLETFQGGYERDFCVLKHNLVHACNKQDAKQYSFW